MDSSTAPRLAARRRARPVLVGAVVLALVAAGSLLALGLPDAHPEPDRLAAADAQAAGRAAGPSGPADHTGRPSAPAPAAQPSDPPAATRRPATDRSAAPAATIWPSTRRQLSDIAATDAGATGTPTRRSGWICAGATRLEDAGSRWSLGRVSFRDMGAYERVILHLQRSGSTRGTSSATAEAFASSSVRSYLRSAARPRSGRMTVGLELEGGIRTGLGLRAFQPRGLQTVRELSVYRSGSQGPRVLISVASDGCFRLRAPGWGADSGGARAQLVIDLRP